MFIGPVSQFDSSPEAPEVLLRKADALIAGFGCGSSYAVKD